MSALSLYIHVPFCSKRCPYCAFFKVTDMSQEQRYVQALCQELSYYSTLVGERTVRTIFFGGGTPNALQPESLDTIMKTLHELFVLDPSVEMTMEMNPEHVTQERLAVVTAYGLNRVSLGIQSFDVHTLKLLGREHTAEHIDVAIQRVRSAGVTNINLDLIFGSPHTSRDHVKQDLDRIITFRPTHVSTYALTIEPGTVFAKQGVQPVSQDESLIRYQWIRRALMQAGYAHYEVSAFAKPGDECEHNLAYWTLSDYIGVGPSGSSYWQGRYYKQINDLEAYCQDPLAKVKQALRQAPMPMGDQLKDALVAGLRLRNGILISVFNRRFGVDLLGEFKAPIQRCKEMGWLRVRKGRLSPTVKGTLMLDTVLEHFV